MMVGLFQIQIIGIITLFISLLASSDQLDGAFKAASKGGTILGCSSMNTSIVICYNKAQLQPERISNNVGAASSGILVDASYAIDFLFQENEMYKLRFDSDMPVRRLASSLASQLHQSTMSLSLRSRPLGIRTVIVGANAGGPQLYEVDPAGSLHRCKVCFIGALSSKLSEKWGNDFDPMLCDSSTVIRHCVRVLRRTLEESGETLDPDQLHIGLVGPGFAFHNADPAYVKAALETDQFNLLLGRFPEEGNVAVDL